MDNPVDNLEDEPIEPAPEVDQTPDQSDAELADLLGLGGLDEESVGAILRALSDPSEGNPFADLTAEEKHLALALAGSQDDRLLEDAWGINYRFRPPAIEDFLDSEYYLGGTQKAIYRVWKNNIGEVFRPDAWITECVFSGAIGLGKTTIAVIMLLYLVIRVTALKRPQEYYEIPAMAPIYFGLFSITREKADQALMGPMVALLRNSNHFVEIKRQETWWLFMQNNPTKVPFAYTDGVVYFPNNIQIVSGSNELHAISLNIMGAILDEAEFRGKKKGQQQAGNEELTDVMNLYKAVRERIRSRFMGKLGYLMCMVSSKRFENSPVETYIREFAMKDPNTKVYNYALWDVKPWEGRYSGRMFKVFVGGKSIEPRVLDDAEVDTFEAPPGYKVIDVPVEHRVEFKTAIYDALRNLAGIATSATNPFFGDEDTIQSVFDPHLWNFTVPKITTDMLNKHCLIELLVRTPLIYRMMNGNFKFKRAPTAPRWFRLDMSESKDHTGLSVCHKELMRDGRTVFVFDFALDIDPGFQGIHLDALWQFPRDLRGRCGLLIKAVTSDKYQSSQGIQGLKNDGWEATHLSVDRTKEPYTLFRAYAINGQVKVGYRARIDAELRNLEDVGDKIDHQPNGSKDITDTMAGNVYVASLDPSTPTYIWEDENERTATSGHPQPLDVMLPHRTNPDGSEPDNEDLFNALFSRHLIDE